MATTRKYKTLQNTTKLVAKTSLKRTPTKTTITKTSPEFIELSTAMLRKAANTSFLQAAARTLHVMGYNVIVEKGWVVKKFKDGTVVRLSKIKTPKKNKVALD